MLYREIMAVCSEINIKHINTLYEVNVEMLNVKASKQWTFNGHPNSFTWPY